MGHTNPYMKHGLFDWETLNVKFGGPLSKPENVFVAQALRVPPYSYLVKERESLGGGWYGATETVTKIEDEAFVIVYNGLVIGYMLSPYKTYSIKTLLLPVNEKAPKPILDFIDVQDLKKGGAE